MKSYNEYYSRFLNLKNDLVIAIDLALARNMDEKELAKSLGVDISMVWRYKKGRICPSKYRLQKLAALADVDYEWLSKNPLKKKNFT